ncbi:MAG: L,D-transpeptidase family protein [Bacteroidales bacterium]|nr:L,D-transpeptidase family protein [Bacteroidales bacterium]
MKKIVLLLFVLVSFSAFSQSYLSNARVKNAYNEKKDFLKEILAEKGINSFNINILIIGLKAEKELQVWVKHKDSTIYEYLITYDFCRLSGDLGLKRVSADGQVPEGFYYINCFNPYSSFIVSLGVNYPNKSDLILGDKDNPGSDIYIHGGCATIGCIPITDDKIKELYILAVMAKEVGQSKIPIYLFPTALSDENFKKLSSNSRYLKNIKFWQNLKQGYDIFVNNKKELKFSINSEGEYVFSNVN